VREYSWDSAGERLDEVHRVVAERVGNARLRDRTTA
jgi:hypothetical protein